MNMFDDVHKFLLCTPHKKKKIQMQYVPMCVCLGSVSSVSVSEKKL